MWIHDKRMKTLTNSKTPAVACKTPQGHHQETTETPPSKDQGTTETAPRDHKESTCLCVKLAIEPDKTWDNGATRKNHIPARDPKQCCKEHDEEIPG